MLAERPDPIESAELAGLKYVSDARAGIRRKRSGRGFAYSMPDGSPVRDATTLLRIKHLVIPPAWTDVWICPFSNGHIQVTARDARGRKQYRYHERWAQVRDAAKYERLQAFGEALPRIRAATERDLGQRGLPRTKVLAAVVRLLAETSIRIGNEEYRRENRSFGLTTLRDEHAEFAGASTLRFHFPGKSGKEHVVELNDRRLARIVRQCQEIPGQELFQYIDDAIVIVENAAHHIDRGGLAPKEATIKAMSEVIGPVIGITLVLMAVFLPTAFLGGITGQLYRQFALTIAATAVISAINAVTLKPAQCAAYLRPDARAEERLLPGLQRGLRPLRGGLHRGRPPAGPAHVAAMMLAVRRPWSALTGWWFTRLPTGFLPTEDQGYAIVGDPAPRRRLAGADPGGRRQGRGDPQEDARGGHAGS